MWCTGPDAKALLPLSPRPAWGALICAATPKAGSFRVRRVRRVRRVALRCGVAPTDGTRVVEVDEGALHGRPCGKGMGTPVPHCSAL